MPSWSPCNYAFNNPIKFIDPEGKKPIPNKILGHRLKDISRLATFEKAWKNSNHGGKFVQDIAEWSFVVTISSNEEFYIGRNLRTDNNSGKVSVDITNIPNTEKIIGHVHTHPYSKSEGEYLGVDLSAGDLSNLRLNASEGGFFSMVEAGNKRYAAVISDPEKASEFFKNNSRADIVRKFDRAFRSPENSELTFQQKNDKGIMAVVGNSKDSGITIFSTSNSNKNNFQPLN